MKYRIETLHEKKLIGQKAVMSLMDNTTGLLWKNFMPRRHEIKNKIGSELFSVNIYDENYFVQFNPNTIFEKWAAAEVSDFNTVPQDMGVLTIPAGLYAVFLYKGAASEAAGFFQQIFGEWLPASEYILGNRPHFEVLGAKYKNDSPDSEEEIWIPVIRK